MIKHTLGLLRVGCNMSSVRFSGTFISPPKESDIEFYVHSSLHFFLCAKFTVIKEKRIKEQYFPFFLTTVRQSLLAAVASNNVHFISTSLYGRDRMKREKSEEMHSKPIL